VTRRDVERLDDVLAAIEAIRAHLRRGDLNDGLVYDAVRARLIEIGEAVKNTGADVLAAEPKIAWADIGGMRDRLAHRYFDTSHAIVHSTIETDLPPLEEAIRRLLSTFSEDK
jgi:uncharacterized protein with HEPN domain